MTPALTAGRDRGHAVRTRATSRPPIRVLASLAAALVLGAMAIAACGPSVPSIPTLQPVTPAATPAGSGAVSARPTPWPGNSVLGMEALGAADGQIGAAVTDLNRSVADEDLSLMREAADGLAKLDELLPNMERIRLNPAMVPFADKYEPAITSIDEAATRLRDAIDAGDAAAIATATSDLYDALATYTALQAELADWVRQIPDQKRLLVN